MEFNENFHLSLIENMISGCAYHRLITDENGKPVDYEYLEVNKTFERQTGMKRCDIVGKRISEINQVMDKEAFDWIRFFGEVVLNGFSKYTEQYSQTFDKWYSVNAYAPEPGYFVAIFNDITDYKKTEERFERAQSISLVGNWEINLATKEIWGSKEAFRLYGLPLTSENLDLKAIQAIVCPRDRKKMDKALKGLIEDGTKYDEVFQIMRADNFEERYMHTMAEVIYDTDKKPLKVSGVIQDITESMKQELLLKKNNEEMNALYEEVLASEEELQQQVEQIQNHRALLALSEQRYRTLVDNSQDVIYSCDIKGRFTTVNKKFCDFVGLSFEEVDGKTMYDLYPVTTPGSLWEKTFAQVIEKGQTERYKKEFKSDQGDRFLNVTLSPIYDHCGAIVGVSGTNHDITEIKHNEAVISQMANYDVLTNLPNRLLLSERLHQAMESARESNTKSMVVFMDLDDFKKVNDTLGHILGDQLLKESAKRILACMGEGDTVARFGGDEFTLLIENVEDHRDVVDTIEKITAQFNQPFHIMDNTITVTTSLGIAVYPDDGESIEDLLKYADTAMYTAKEQGKNRYRFFNQAMKENLIQKTNIEKMLRKAIRENEFVLQFQPQYEAKTRKLRGFESLIRWNSPELGYLFPDQFIPVAEETGLITFIGEWVMREACYKCKELNDKYGLDLVFAVNISPIELRQNYFYEKVLDVLNLTGLEPSNLEIEVTENIFIHNADVVIDVLKDLKAFGVRIALDDFGTGYSSFSYLKKLPINLLKIDKAFIQEIGDHMAQNELTESIISMVHNLKIDTLAEGVETKEQLAFLENTRCNMLQGYYFTKPVDASEVEGIIERNAVGDVCEVEICS